MPVVAMVVVLAALAAAGCGSDDGRASPSPDAESAAPRSGGDVDTTADGSPSAAAPPPVIAGESPAPAGAASPAPASAAAAAASPGRSLAGGDVRRFPDSSVWEALRQCETGGDYGDVDPSGQYFGAYQFTTATWDRLATRRDGDLVGVLPSQAAPADQDRMAHLLWLESGRARWPACSHVFTDSEPPEGAITPGADGNTTSSGDTGSAGDSGTEAAPPSGEADGIADEGAVTADEDENRVSNLPELDVDPAIQPAVPPDVPGFPTPEQWAALRQCESSGNYQVVDKSGRFFGAYQFWPETWDFVAKQSYPRLVGVLPSAATPQDQDRMAYRIYEQRGDQPWPVCGSHLR